MYTCFNISLCIYVYYEGVCKVVVVIITLYRAHACSEYLQVGTGMVRIFTLEVHNAHDKQKNCRLVKEQ